MTRDAEPSEPLDEKDLPLEQDLRDDDQAEMVRCPHCDKFIYEETLKCPHCEEWIIDRAASEVGRSKWFWPIVIAIGAAMILVTLIAKSIL